MKHGSGQWPGAGPSAGRDDSISGDASQHGETQPANAGLGTDLAEQDGAGGKAENCADAFEEPQRTESGARTSGSLNRQSVERRPDQGVADAQARDGDRDGPEATPEGERKQGHAGSERAGYHQRDRADPAIGQPRYRRREEDHREVIKHDDPADLCRP